MATATTSVDPSTTTRTTLRDPSLQAALEDDGFVVVPFLDAAEVEAARSFFSTLGSPGHRGFQTDFERPAPERKRLIHEALSSRWQTHLDDVLNRYRPFMSTFLAKWPGPGSSLYLHQDWCYVDEQQFRSVVVWVALEDIDAHRGNGPLQVLPGSHRVAGEYRGTRTTSWYTEHEEAITASLVTVEARAGDAVIMDNALVHSSPDNTSDDVRLAAALACVPTEAPLLHAVARGDGTVERLAVDDQFFREETPTRLRDEVPAEWAKTAVVVPETWRAADLRLASRLCGTGLPGPTPLGALGGSQPPPADGPLVTRLASRLLRANHQAIESQPIEEGPFLDPRDFLGIDSLENDWPTILSEYVELCREGSSEAPLPTLAGAELPNVGPWRAVVLRDHTGWSPEAVERCPQTIAALRRIPGVRTAMFSTLGPWARIEPHRGVNKGVLRAHLGVVVPGPPGRATMWAGAEQTSWREGRTFVFDDTFEHRVANRTGGSRVSLMVEFDRPLGGARRALNQAVQASFRFHPHARGARARRQAIQDALDA